MIFSCITQFGVDLHRQKFDILQNTPFKNVYDAFIIEKWMQVFYKRFFAQQFKRSCLPDGPKVGTVTLFSEG
jgi:NAD+ synthase (glutamine-hydrolysing)